MGLRSQLDLRLGVLLSCIAFLLLAACQKSESPSESYRQQSPEKPYSATPTSYAEPTTLVTATALFNRYNDMGAAGLNSLENGLPIRYAEVHVLDASGNQIQQGETDASGNISLRIPRSAGSYTLRVNSRADNSYYKVSVLKDPFETQYYSLDQGFTLSGGEVTSAVTMPAAAATNDSDVMGGAFNIMDQVFVANEFLRTQAYSATCPMCVNDFTVAPKIQIFWQKGLTPGAYLGEPQIPISFFSADSGGGLYRGLYLLGGIEGSVCNDTDHFDRTIILHEYGHFLENAYGKSASPGGAHDGNSIIDPRLAWSEGWADFFQAAALGRRIYRDTYQNAACAGGAKLSIPDISLENRTSHDVPVTDEGIFREISVARTLFDTMTGASQSSTYSMTYDADSYAVDIGFAPIWHAFKSLAGTQFRFQNMGIWNQQTKTYITANYNSGTQTSLASVMSYEGQADTQRLYGQKLVPQAGSAGACSYSFASAGPVPEDDLLRNNDFYYYEYDGNPDNAVLTLRYKKTGNEASVPFDVDLYVYNEHHVLLDTRDIVAFSEASYPEPEGTASDPGYERVSLLGLPAGTYMLNVRVAYSVQLATTSYYLETSSGAQLCP